MVYLIDDSNRPDSIFANNTDNVIRDKNRPSFLPCCSSGDFQKPFSSISRSESQTQNLQWNCEIFTNRSIRSSSDEVIKWTYELISFSPTLLLNFCIISFFLF